MKKRLLSLLLCLLTLTSVVTTALAAGFADVKAGAYYAEAVS